ncbi:hypothetical protein AB1N83_012301 [Pleurotus pulmonarius]
MCTLWTPQRRSVRATVLPDSGEDLLFVIGEGMSDMALALLRDKILAHWCTERDHLVVSCGSPFIRYDADVPTEKCAKPPVD